MKNSVRVKLPDQSHYWIFNGNFMRYTTKAGCLHVYKWFVIPVHVYASGQWEFAFVSHSEYNENLKEPKMLTNTIDNIYQAMIDANQEISNHESDLYVYVNDVTKEIVSKYTFKQNVTTFRSNIDGKLMFDIPFAYMPFWDQRQCKAAKAVTGK